MRGGERQATHYVVSWYRDGSGMENGPTVRFFASEQVKEIAQYAASEAEMGKAIDVRGVPTIDITKDRAS